MELNNMKTTFVVLVSTLGLSGCLTLGPGDYTSYVESAKSISRDSTVAQTACWNAIIEIAKNGDSGAKVGAIALAEKCKNNIVTVSPPKKGILGF
jgi:hypothetical protein